MSEVSFVVPGTPVAKGRPRFARRGNFVSTYTPEKTASYENLVKLYASQAMQGKDLITGPVEVRVFLFVKPPASWSGKKQRRAILGEIFPTTKPDIDNTCKLLADACNEIVWKDDKQIVDLAVRKRYSETARAMVQITLL